MTTQALSVKTEPMIQSAKGFLGLTKKQTDPLSLNRYVQVQPAELTKLHLRKEKIWNIAAMACLVAYVVLATCAFVASNILAPAWVPLILAVIFTLSPVIYFSCYAKMKAMADDHAAKAIVEAGVARHLELLPTAPEKITRILSSCGINAKNIKNIDKLKSLTDLRPVIARFQYWNEVSDTALAKYRKGRGMLLRVNVETAQDGKKIQALRKEALEQLESSQVAKVRSALQLKILQDPCLRGDENDNDFFSFQFPSIEERLVRKHFMDPSWDVIGVRKNKTKDLIGFEALVNRAPRDIFPIRA